MVAQSEAGTSTLVNVTPAAAEQVKLVLTERERPNGALRLFISARNGAGFQYGMAIADGPDADDVLIEQHGVRLIVDNVSAPFLSGAEIDFVDTVMQKGFTITNPNATGGGGCACGGGGCNCGGGHGH
ncbi:MAG: HesB/IscA family protein [Dehalococcoidia bacterium]